MTDDKPTIIVEPTRGVVSVASNAIDALRGSPLLIVMVVLNCAFLAAAAFYLRNQQDHVYRLVDKIFDHCLVKPPDGVKP